MLSFTMILAIAALLAPSVFAVKGVDVSSLTLPESWDCLKSNGYDFGIIRCFESIGHPDPNCPHTLYNAWEHMDHVDVYMFPCFSCGSPSSQVDKMVQYLESFNIKPDPKGGKNTYGQIWLDIEGPQYWSRSTSENVDFIKGLISAVEGHGINVAVYTSESQWGPITGNADIASSKPLWYAHYDDDPGFGDFAPFAGWTHPAMKQFKGTTDICSASVDLNYYP